MQKKVFGIGCRKVLLELSFGPVAVPFCPTKGYHNLSLKSNSIPTFRAGRRLLLPVLIYGGGCSWLFRGKVEDEAVANLDEELELFSRADQFAWEFQAIGQFRAVQDLVCFYWISHFHFFLKLSEWNAFMSDSQASWDICWSKSILLHIGLLQNVSGLKFC